MNIIAFLLEFVELLELLAEKYVVIMLHKLAYVLVEKIKVRLKAFSNPALAFLPMLCMAGFLTLCLSVCLCVSVDKISEKTINHSTLFSVGA